MLALNSLRLYFDYRGSPQPRLLEGVVLSFAIGSLLVAIIFGIAIVRRSVLPIRWGLVAGGALAAIASFATVAVFGRQ
jgi:hypothetical protein